MMMAAKQKTRNNPHESMATPSPERTITTPERLSYHHNNVLLTIALVDSAVVRQRLRQAVNAMVESLEAARSTLQDKYDLQVLKYQKAVREMQFFKRKYEMLQQRISISSDSKKASSCSSSRRPSNTSSRDSYSSAMDFPMKEEAQGRQHSSNNNNGQDKDEETIDLVSLLSAHGHIDAFMESHPSQSPPSLHSPALASSNSSVFSSTTTSSSKHSSVVSFPSTFSSSSTSRRSDSIRSGSQLLPNISSFLDSSVRIEEEEPPSSSPENRSNQEAKNSDSKDPRNEELTFACGDGFWDTIARGKNKKDEVDTLISNYLRRGGQPNVAKNSASLKAVKEGFGLVHALVAIKNGRALSRVIDAGANPNAIPLTTKKEDRIPPLVFAGQVGYLNGVRILLERGKADLYQRGPNQETVLHAAVEKNAVDVVVYLLRAFKDPLVNIVDVHGASPLHYACMYGHTGLVTLFIRECQTKPDPQDHRGETPLHYAVRYRQLKVVTKLVGDLGVYPNPYVSKQVPTPLDLAKSGGFNTISEYLRKMGAQTAKEMEKTFAFPSSSSLRPKAQQQQRIISPNSSRIETCSSIKTCTSGHTTGSSNDSTID